LVSITGINYIQDVKKLGLFKSKVSTI